MGLYIPNMEMPKSCRECPFDDGNWVCQPLYKSEKFKCPLIEISTPHGRFIDADKLFWEEVGKIKPRNDEHYKAIGEFMNMITNAPTIIEAED